MKRLLAAISLFSMGFVLAPSLMAQTKIVNHLTMNQWVCPDQAGLLKGRVFLPKTDGEIGAMKEVKVAIMSRDGEVLRGTTNSVGEFTIEDVEPGVYALTARGDNVFACCAMHVIDNNLDGKFPNVAEIEIANVDYTVVNTAVIRYLPPNVKTGDLSISDAKLAGLANRVCGQDMFRVAQFNGGMKGRIHLAGAIGSDLTGADMTNVFIFEDGMEIDRTLTDENGQFVIDRIKPGYYSLLAVGPGGLGLIGFELVDQAELTETAAITSSSGERLVGFGHRRNGCCCQEFAIQVAPMPEVVSCVEEVILSDNVVDAGYGAGNEAQILDGGVVMDGFGSPVPGGGFSGGYGGNYGGGGGGGGGFGGGIGALAGIGGIIAATTNDNNNSITPPIVASPFFPN